MSELGLKLLGDVLITESVQFKTMSMRYKKAIFGRSTPSVRSFPSVAFETVPVFVWLAMALSRPFQGRSSSASSFHASLVQAIHGVMSLALSVPAGSVSSSSTLKIFRGASHLWLLLSPPFCLLGHFPSLLPVYDRTCTGVSEDGCETLTHASLGGLPGSLSSFCS